MTCLKMAGRSTLKRNNCGLGSEEKEAIIFSYTSTTRLLFLLETFYFEILFLIDIQHTAAALKSQVA